MTERIKTCPSRKEVKNEILYSLWSLDYKYLFLDLKNLKKLKIYYKSRIKERSEIIRVFISVLKIIAPERRNL